MLQKIVDKCGICTRKGENIFQINTNATNRSNADVINMINLCPQQSQLLRHVECNSCSSDTDVHHRRQGWWGRCNTRTRKIADVSFSGPFCKSYDHGQSQQMKFEEDMTGMTALS